MALISRDKIDALIETVDIVDVISEYVPLQASGKSMKGLCPFHSEKTPSFHVSKDKQLFNCFGCHKKGNVITFIQEYKHLDFIESVRYLADQYHFDLEEEDYQVERFNYGKLYEVNKLAKDFYNLNLLNLDTGKKALAYLESRQISKQTLSLFNVGYAPGKGQALYENLSEKFQAFEMVEAGLVGRSDSGNYYDLFRDRIMFPIENEQGKVVGFSGRRLNDDKTQPKYINTHATKIFNKGTVLYNLFRAMPHILKKKRMVLMEGFFDVIQASLAGIEEAVCSMGTELTIDQAKTIKKHTDAVVICYDGDQAGKEASYRALNILEKVGLNVQIALMPDGLDPDDYIKQYSHAHFRNQLNQQLIDKFDFVYEMIIQKGISTSSEIESAKHALFKFLLNSASKTITSIYLQKFAEAIDLPYDVINQDFQKYLVQQRRHQVVEQTIRNVKVPKVSKARITAEEKIINYYFQNDSYRDLIDDGFISSFQFSKGIRREIFITMTEMYHNQRDVALYNLKTDLTDAVYQALNKLLLKEDYVYSEKELLDLIGTLGFHTLKDEIDDISERFKDALERKDMDLARNLQSQVAEKKKLVAKIMENRHKKSNRNI